MCDCYFDEALIDLEVTEKQEEAIPVEMTVARRARK